MVFPIDLQGTWVNEPDVDLDAGELRRADMAMFGGAGSALGVHGGIVRHGDTSLAVSVDGSDIVTIQPGAVVIPGDAVAGTGCYRCALPAAATGALQARHATNPRIDLLVFRQMDEDPTVVPSHGASTGRIQPVVGAPSGTPVIGTFPSMAVELGRIYVPPVGGGAATVDLSFRTYAFAVGGEMIVPSVSRLPASAAKWQAARALDTGLEYTFNGTTWVRTTLRSKWGAVTLTPNGSGAVTITHGLGVTPAAVFVQPVQSNLHAAADMSTATSTQVTAYVRDLTTGALITSGSRPFIWDAKE